MNWKFLTILVLMFSFSFVSAHYERDFDYKEKIVMTKYYPEKSFSVTTTRYSDYDNADRYSTYDYRHGYTYRETKNYWSDYYELDYYKPSYHKSWDYHDDRGYSGHWKSYDSKDYYYDYIPHLRDYEVVECYHHPPRDQLFYIKCP